MRRTNVLPIFLVAAAVVNFSVYGVQAQHAGDIEIEVIGGKLATEEQIYDVDFDELGGVLWATDPGFEADPGTFSPGDQVGFNVTQKLYYWDGTQLTTPAGNPPLTISLGPLSVIVDAMTDSEPGFIFATAGSDGSIHRHLNFEMPLSSPVGAYGLVLDLFSPQYSNSDEFLIVFNNGLGGAQFDAGVDAIADAAFAVVPEPSAYMLWAAGVSLAGVAFLWRRRRRRAVPTDC